jgi:hypothetical protein
MGVATSAGARTSTTIMATGGNARACAEASTGLGSSGSNGSKAAAGAIVSIAEALVDMSCDANGDAGYDLGAQLGRWRRAEEDQRANAAWFLCSLSM